MFDCGGKAFILERVMVCSTYGVVLLGTFYSLDTYDMDTIAINKLCKLNFSCT